jgi:hypothetical protein
MKLHNITAKAKQKFFEAQERVARTILIWLEKEPSQDRLLSTSGSVEPCGPYIRYRSRGKRRGAEKDKAHQKHIRNAA